MRIIRQEMHGNDANIIGAVKIKDGLFIGDEYAAQDLEFVVTNKVTHIINCSGKQIQNHWETIGVSYLTFKWIETDYQVLFDTKDEVINDIYRFIESSLAKGESVLVHSVKGQNRSCCVLAAYLMKKYKWTLYKTLEFLHSRKPNLEIRSNFFSQLTNLEGRLAKQGIGAKTSTWNEISDDPKNIESDELLLTNTFLNSKKPPSNETNGGMSPKKDSVKNKVNFSDKVFVQHHPKEKKFTGMFQSNDAKKRDEDGSTKSEKTVLKSILKGSGKTFTLKPEDPNLSASQNPSPNATITKPTSGLSSLQRPSSSQGFTIKTLGQKQLSSTVKDFGLDPSGTLQGATNIQGNIIHITVNNYITNSNVTTNNAGLESAQNVQNTQGKQGKKVVLDEMRPERGLSANNSNKEITVSKSNSEGKLFGKAVFSPSATVELKNGLASSKGFSGTVSTDQPKKPARNLDNDGDESPATRNYRFKINNAPNKTSIIVYGNQPAPKVLDSDRKSAFNHRLTGSMQISDKDLKITGTSSLMLSNNVSDNRTPTYYKYLNPGQGGPVRPIQDLKTRDLAMSDTNFYPGPGQQNFNTQKEKTIARPTTAPEQKISNQMKNSPYFTTSQSATFIKRKGRPIGTESAQEPREQRQSSIQPSKEDSESNGFDKNRLRSSSPAQPKNTLFNYFQEISNKPRWKF